MFVSKLDIKKYKWANPNRWLRFVYSKQREIDPVFAGRLAALGEYLGWVIVIIRGAVSTEDQRAIAERKIQQNPTWVMRPNGAVYNERGQCMVAAPGTSPHEQRLAIDGDKRIEALSNYILGKFGLCRPMPYEPWHIQPIETKGKPYAAREAFVPVEIEGTLVENQRRVGEVPDNIYGPKSHAAFTEELF